MDKETRKEGQGRGRWRAATTDLGAALPASEGHHQNLASELGVSERTIRRDVEILTRTYPLETICGRYGGGVRVADWYHLDRQRMSPRQTALLRRLAAGLRGEDLELMEQILLKFAS